MTVRFNTTEWRAIVTRYATAEVTRSFGQLALNLSALVATLYVAYRLMEPVPWATALLVLLVSGFLIRTFIIMHDCAHGSFTPWPKVNDAIGFVTGVLMLTPYQQWRREHAIHHASAGDLERRGTGDINTLTVAEYEARSRFGKLKYRLYRNPVVLFVLGPLHLMVLQRFRVPGPVTGPAQLWNVWLTNIALAATATIFILTAGWQSVVLLYLPAVYIAGAIGVGLFYVQHQFEDVYWEKDGGWSPTAAALEGSSFYKLPRVLQWFSGNIGFHHIHHLNSRIPNYNLERCFLACPTFQDVRPITLLSSLKTIRLRLWDARNRRMIGFRELKSYPVPGGARA